MSRDDLDTLERLLLDLLAAPTCRVMRYRAPPAWRQAVPQVLRVVRHRRAAAC